MSLVKVGLCLIPIAFSGCSGGAFRPRPDPKGDSELAFISGATNRVLTFSQLSQALPKVTATVNDPVYNKPKRYEGFWLADVLKYTGLRFDHDSVLIISALDGYQARLPRPSLDAKPLLAVRDLDQPAGWELIRNGKEMVSPGPFYLVWQTAAGTSASELPWPYQIARLEMRNAGDSERHLLPPGAELRPDVKRGFAVFARSCIPCHSINLEGGVVGPELNVPRNITEYRERSFLAEFIHDPGNFRARSKMPAFKDSISREQMDEVLSYLAWMRDHKISNGK